MGQPFSERVLKHWIERLTPGLIQVSFGICHDRHRAEEIVQEAWVRIWKAPPDAGEPAISSWMRTTVTNLAISSIRRKKRTWTLIDEKKNDHSPEDAQRHDPTDEVAAFKLAGQAWPGAFGVFYENKSRATKNALEADLIRKAKERTKGAADLALLQSTFAKMR